MPLKRNLHRMRKLLGIDGLLAEAGFLDIIQTIAADPPKSDLATYVPAEDFLTAVQAIARNGPDASPSETPDWHREKSATHAGKAASYKDQAASTWRSDPAIAADHLLRSIEHDVKRQYHSGKSNGTPPPKAPKGD